MTSSSRLHSLLPAVAALVLFGCEQKRAETTPTSASASAAAPASAPAAPATASAAPAASAPAVTPTPEAKMAEHFSSSAAMRDALVKGDLEAFRAAASTLSDKELSANLSDTWKPHLEGMRTAAKSARDAKTIEAGAKAFAELGRACAACHEKIGGPKKLEIGEAPPGGSGAKPHMARHHWAAARLWDGLMAPSQEAWTKGAEAFTDAPLVAEAVAGPKSVPPEIDELAKRAHAFGHDAHKAKDAAARAKAVADVYGTCVGCHKKLAVSIK